MLALLPTFNDILSFLTNYSYIALILMLLAAGMGVPIPEDIPLILSGYMTHPDYPIMANGYVPSLFLMCCAGMFGVLAGDSIVFFIGRHGINSNNFVARHVQKVMTPKRLAWAEKHFAKHGNLTVFAGRFMPGLRAVVFAMAGASRMSYFRFILVNGIAALLSVPAWVILGHYLASWVPREGLEAKIKEYQHIILPVLGGIAVVVGIFLFIRYKRRKAAQADAPVADKTPDSPAGAPPAVSDAASAGTARVGVPETSVKE